MRPRRAGAAVTSDARRPSSRPHPVDASGDRPRVGGVHEEARVADDLGERATVVGDDRQTHRHGLDHRHAEALVLRRDDQHVGPGHGGHQLGVAERAVEPDGVVQAQLVDEAVQGGRVGRRHGPPHDFERGRAVVVGAGDQQRHHRQLDPFVRGEPSHAEPAGSGPGRRSAPRGTGDPARVDDRRGRDDRRAGEPTAAARTR